MEDASSTTAKTVVCPSPYRRRMVYKDSKKSPTSSAEGSERCVFRDIDRAPSYPVDLDILASSLIYIIKWPLQSVCSPVVEFSNTGNDKFDPTSSSADLFPICRIPAWRPITTGRSSPKQEQRLKQGVSKKPMRKCATPCPATPKAAAATPKTAFVTADPTSSYAKRMAYTGRLHLQTYKACKAKYADRREYSILA